MNKGWSRLVGWLAVMGVCMAAVPASADTCKSVDIDVKNDKAVKILALSIDFKAKTDNQVRHESFNNAEVSSSATTRVASNQNLSGIEGYDMEYITLHYKAFCGGKWSKEFTVTDRSFDSAKCSSGRAYRIDVPSTDVCN